MKRVALLLLCLIVAGCAATDGPQGFLSSIFGRKAKAAAKAEAQVTTLENETTTFAHVEVFKTSLALAAAPSSLPVAIARRTNTNALEVLNQREPLAASVAAEARTIVEGLLAEKAEAEKAQQAAEASLRGKSQELSTIRAIAKKLGQQAEAEAQKNLAIANELRWANVVKWSGVAASTVMGLLAIAYKLNIGRLQEGLANTLAHVQTEHGDEAGKVARLVAGEVLHTGEQKGVYKIFSNLAAK